MAPKGSRESGGFFAPSGAQCRAGGAEGPHPEDAGGISAPFSLRGKEKAAGGKKKTAKGEFRFSPFANPCKTTKKGTEVPFLDFSRGLACAKHIQNQQDAMQMRIWIDRRGSRNTLRLFRLPYVKYSTGAYVTIRTAHRALRKPNLTVARRAFGLRTGERKYVKRNDLFFRASALFRVPCASFLHTFFWQDRKKYVREATVAVAQ